MDIQDDIKLVSHSFDMLKSLATDECREASASQAQIQSPKLSIENSEDDNSFCLQLNEESDSESDKCEGSKGANEVNIPTEEIGPNEKTENDTGPKKDINHIGLKEICEIKEANVEIECTQETIKSTVKCEANKGLSEDDCILVSDTQYSTVTHENSTAPDDQHSTVTQENSSVPQETSTVPDDKHSTVTQENSSVPQETSSVPQETSTVPDDKQSTVPDHEQSTVPDNEQSTVSDDIPDLTDCPQGVLTKAKHVDEMKVPEPDEDDENISAVRKSLNMQFAACIEDLCVNPASDGESPHSEEQPELSLIMDPDQARKDKKCLICHVAIPNDAAWKSHKSGGPHVKKAPVYEFIKKKEGYKSMKGVSVIQPTLKSRDVQFAMGEDTIYEFHMRNEEGKADFVLWTCSVCCCASPSVIRAKEHIKSDQHRLNYLDENYPALKAKLPSNLAYVPRKLNHIAGMVRNWKQATPPTPHVYELTIDSHSLLVMLGLKQARPTPALSTKTPVPAPKKFSLLPCPILEKLKVMSMTASNGNDCNLCAAKFESNSMREWHDRSSSHKKKAFVFNLLTAANQYTQINAESCVLQELEKDDKRIFGGDSLIEMYVEGTKEMLLWMCTVCFVAGKNAQSALAHLTTHAHAMTYLSVQAPALRPMNENSFNLLEEKLIRAFKAYNSQNTHPTTYRLSKSNTDLLKRWTALGILEPFYLKPPLKKAAAPQPLVDTSVPPPLLKPSPVKVAENGAEISIPLKINPSSTKFCGVQLCRTHYSNKTIMEDHVKSDTTHLLKQNFANFMKKIGFQYSHLNNASASAKIVKYAKETYKWLLGDECIHEFFVDLQEYGSRNVLYPMFWVCSICFVGDSDEVMGKTHLLSHSHQLNYLEDHYPSYKPSSRLSVMDMAVALVKAYDKIKAKHPDKDSNAATFLVEYDKVLDLMEHLKIRTTKMPTVVMKMLKKCAARSGPVAKVQGTLPFNMQSLDNKTISHSLILKSVATCTPQSLLQLNIPIRRFDNNCQLCNMTVQGPNAWDQHLKQLKHKEREAVYGFLKSKNPKFTLGASSFQSAINFTFHKSSNMIGDCALFEFHPKNSLHAILGTKAKVEEVVFWACSVCFIARTDPLGVPEHLISNEHRLNYLRLMRSHLVEDMNIYGCDMAHPSLTTFLNNVCTQLRPFLSVTERVISVATLTVESQSIMSQFNLSWPDFRVTLTCGQTTPVVLKRVNRFAPEEPVAKAQKTGMEGGVTFEQMAKMMKLASSQDTEPSKGGSKPSTSNSSMEQSMVDALSTLMGESSGEKANAKPNEPNEHGHGDMDVSDDDEDAVLTLTGSLRRNEATRTYTPTHQSSPPVRDVFLADFMKTQAVEQNPSSLSEWPNERDSNLPAHRVVPTPEPGATNVPPPQTDGYGQRPVYDPSKPLNESLESVDRSVKERYPSNLREWPKTTPTQGQPTHNLREWPDDPALMYKPSPTSNIQEWPSATRPSYTSQPPNLPQASVPSYPPPQLPLRDLSAVPPSNALSYPPPQLPLRDWTTEPPVNVPAHRLDNTPQDTLLRDWPNPSTENVPGHKFGAPQSLEPLYPVNQGPFAAPPPVSQGSYGAPPPVPQGSYPAPPPVPQGSYAAPPPVPQGSYAAPPPVPQGSYAAPPPVPQGSYAAPPPVPQGSYAAPPPVPQGSYAAPPPVPQGSYAAPPPVPQGSYAAPPPVPQGSYAAPPPVPQGSYAAPPPISRGLYAAPPPAHPQSIGDWPDHPPPNLPSHQVRQPPRSIDLQDWPTEPPVNVTVHRVGNPEWDRGPPPGSLSRMDSDWSRETAPIRRELAPSVSRDTVNRVSGLLNAWRREEALKFQARTDSSHDIAIRLVNILKEGNADLSEQQATTLLSDLMSNKL